MDIEELRTLVEVADLGGITPAAHRLGISKSIVSRRLSRLEEELGAQLVSRSTRGAALTEAGVLFRDYAARACAEIDAARESISPDGELRGRLRISAPLTFGPTHLAPVFAEMARRHPSLHISTFYSDRFVDLVAEGFDCAVRIGYLKESNLIARCIGPLHGRLVASPEYIRKHGAPESPDELLSHQALMQGMESWQFTDGDAVVTVHPQGRFKADSAVALVTAAVSGLGVALIPDSIMQEHLASGALVPIMTRYPPPAAGIFVVRPPSQHPVRKVRVLIEMLSECFSSSPEAGAAGAL